MLKKFAIASLCLFASCTVRHTGQFVVVNIAPCTPGDVKGYSYTRVFFSDGQSCKVHGCSWIVGDTFTAETDASGRIIKCLQGEDLDE